MNRESTSPATMSARQRLIAEIERRKRRKTDLLATIPACHLDAYPLSYPQRRLWFLDQMQGANAAYNIGVAIRFEGGIDIECMRRAIEGLAQRHAVLRSVIERGPDGEPVQRVRDGLLPEWRVVDLSALPQHALAQAVEDEKRREIAGDFDFSTQSTLRALLLKCAADSHCLVLTLHHISGDGWSLNVMLRDLLGIYEAERSGHASALPMLSIQYGDFAKWQRQADADDGRDIEFWQQWLADAPALLPLPTDRARPAEASFAGALHHSNIDAALVARVDAFARRNQLSLFNVMSAAFAVLLGRLSGQSDLVIGTPVANRDRPELADLVGFFVNSLPLRMRLDRADNFLEFAMQTRDATFDAFEHQSVPFERLVDALDAPRSLSHAPVFQVMFGLNNTAELPSSLPMGETTGFIEPLPAGGAKLDLSVSFNSVEGSLEGHWEYATDLFDPQTIASIAERYRNALEHLIEHDQAPLDRLPLCTPEETERVLSWAQGVSPVDAFEHPAAAIARHARHSPDAIALADDDITLSYAALDRAAERIATRFRDAGVLAEDRVALMLGSGAPLVLCMLAVVKAGACYVPIDPALPLRRRSTIVEDCDARLVVVGPGVEVRDAGMQAADAAEAHASFAPHIALSELLTAAADSTALPAASAPPEEALSDVELDAGRLAYVIYTSGTTGVPKGVAVSARGLHNLACWHARTFGVDVTARASQVAGVGFDAMAWEVWPYLMHGGCVVFPGAEARSTPRRLSAALDTLAATHAFMPTPMAEAVLAEGMLDEGLQSDRSSAARGNGRSLRWLLIGGDALGPVHALPDALQVSNNYGPTESTVVSTSCAVVADGRLPAIGAPIDGLRTYVLDSAANPVPLGVLGELYVGGLGLARGYLGRPDLTAERFVPDPYSSTPGERLYRTGDLVRWRGDGHLEFGGRIDDQVKVRGFRIEIAEIESHLRRDARVREALVLLREDAVGGKRLVAYAATEEGASAADLQEALRQTLPDYMVPEFFVLLDRLPTTPNGKVDRRALPAPEWHSTQHLHVAPAGPVEVVLAEIWSDLLDCGPVGRNDNFFALGGHSMLAARMIDAVAARLGVAPSLKSLWSHPTIAELATQLSDAVVDVSTTDSLPTLVHDAAGRHAPFALTDIQQAYWLGRSDAFSIGNVAAHAYSELELYIDTSPVERMEHALNALITRHDMLRMVVAQDGTQRILSDPGRYRLPFFDVSEATAETREGTLLAVREEMSHHVFAIDRWPLFDIRVGKISPHHYRLYWSFDGLVLDGHSQQILIGELQHLLHDPDAVLEPFSVTFRDYVLGLEAMRETGLYRRSQAYWLNRVDDFPAAPELPLAVDPSRITHPKFERREFNLDAARWSELRGRAQALGVTASGLLLAAFADALGAWSKSPRFALNLTMFNRLPLHADVDRMLGDFTSLTLLAIDQDGGATFADRCQRVQRQLWDDIEHRHYTGVEFMRELRRRSGGAVSMPVVFSSMLDMPSWSGAGEEGDGTRVERGFSISQTSQVWIDHQVSESADGLHIAWDAVEALFPSGVLDALFASYTGLLERLSSSDSAWTSRRPVGLPEAQQAVRTQVNATQAAWSEDLLHAGFLAQAERTPDALAVWSRERNLSYGELLRLSRYYGHQLRASGVRPNELVGVVMHKGWEQTVAVLSVLESGAAYLPIDAGLPMARIEQLLRLGEVSRVLTQPGPEEALSWPSSLLRWVVDARALESGEPLPALSPVQDATTLAYVIFTSGSTGEPKGVVIDHQGARNTIDSINALFAVDARDRTLALSSLSFDLSVYDIFGLLTVGGAVVVPDPGLEKDPAHWSALLEQAGVSVWNTVPALMQLLVEYHEQQGNRPLPGTLREVMMSGDWIPVGLPDRIRALSPGVRVTSLGGATEASIWSIYYPIEVVRPEWTSIPYGRPLANQTYHVLRGDLTDCPDWVAGDLYIGGIGLAQGYWRSPEKTASSFIVHPESGERLYRTGDLGRYLPDGDIEFLGREDSQVKIQGFRVELGEIEAALLRQPGVRESVVIASGEAGRHKRLLGYVVLEGESRREPGSEEVIRDPVERALFKLGRPGDRTLDVAGVSLSALPESLGQSWQRLPWNADAPTLESLGGWLCALAARPVEGAPLPKYYYPSSGSLNPIQAYLEVGEGAVAGLSAGTYYYDPVGHRLQALGAVGVVPDGVRLHLVAEQGAVRPLYGRPGDVLCDVEAGYVAELLGLTAPVHGVSLRTAEMDATLSSRLSLGASQRPVLSLEVGSGRAQSADLSLGRVERQSYRRYARRALTQTQWQTLVSGLGAASGVRWYAYVRGQGVEGLPAGYYRIDAETGASTRLAADASEPERRYGGGSAATFAQSAVALYAAGLPTAESRVASGAQSQRAMTAGVKAGVGVCPIGGFNPAGIAEQLELSAGEEVVHSLLAGAIDVEQTLEWEQEPAPQPVVERLRSSLSESLPAYMVPSALMVLERIPLTSNGKVDRRALPQPEEGAGPARAYAAPRTDLERSLAEIWREVLGVERVGVDDHFFEIGGDSLKVVQVQTRVRVRFNTDVQLREMYTHATLGALASALSERVGGVEEDSAGQGASAVKSASLRRRKARQVSEMTDEEVARMLAQRRALKEHADGT